MPTFDIVSEINKVEVSNAVDNANRELATRFDFRGVEASFELVGETVEIVGEGEFQLKQMMDILRNSCVKRGVDTKSLDMQSVDRTGKLHKQKIVFQEGIDQATAKKIIKLIKDAKMKVQTAIQGEKLRVTGKKRDDLQQVMQLVKTADLDQPFQFENFRD